MTERLEIPFVVEAVGCKQVIVLNKKTAMLAVRNLLEDVLDTLIEVGNGTTDKMLHSAADSLFIVRDSLLPVIEKQKGGK